MENYLVSVVTAFRNNDPGLFGKCLDSVIGQSAVADKIEWIIVLHNTDKAHSDSVKSRVREYNNIRVLFLNDYTNTPAAARNLGIENATAPYIMFLDANDTLSAQCVAGAVSCAERNKAQLVCFRKGYTTEARDTAHLAEIVLWNQTYEEIILGKDDIRGNDKLLSGRCGVVTGRLFERGFLNEHNIRFDTSVPYSEETLFVLEVCGNADRICILPQLIGYCQSGSRSDYDKALPNNAPSLISAADGFRKIFDTGISYGLYMNDIMSVLCFDISRRITASNRLSTRDRQKIKDILEPYIGKTVPRKVSKLCSEKVSKEQYEFSRAVILDPESFTGDYEKYTLIPAEENDESGSSEHLRLLRDILDHNGNTDIGERYGFNEIGSLTEFQAKIPVSGYDVYAPLLALQTNIGETGIITADRVRSYVLDLGSMGNARIIPCTDKQLKPLKDTIKEAVTGEKTFLLLESYPRKYRYSDNAVVNTVYGAIISDIFADENISVYAKKAMFTAPTELLFPETVADMTYLRLLFALSERFVKQIIAPNTWELWETFRFLEKNWKNLCADIGSGSPDHFNQVISDEYREIIKGCLIADPGRAQELEEIFAGGFDTPIVPKIWKKLSKITAFGDGSFEIYSAGLERYIGGIKLDNGFFTASAALIGTETNETGRYILESANAFTEFVPTDGSADAVSAFDVVPGGDYALQISTYSGLYRYPLSDVVRIERFEGDIPLFSYRYNAPDTVKLGGCAVTDSDILGSLLALRESEGLAVTDYAYMTDEDNNGIVVLLEINNDEISCLDAAGLSVKLEKLLEEENSGYAEAVGNGNIKPLGIVFIEQETQLFYRDILMSRIKQPSDLIRPVRYINTPAKERFFKSRITG